MPWQPKGHFSVSSTHPRARACCDICNFEYPRADLKWVFQYQGTDLQNLNLLACPQCFDPPQPQLKTIILPPDPVPVWQPRPEPYASEVPSFMVTEDGGDVFTTEGGDPFVTEGIQPNG